MPPEPIKDLVTVGNVPGSPNGQSPSRAGTTTLVTASPTHEYVAGGTGGAGAWYENFARAWPWSIDDVTRDFGDDLYDRMLLDGQIASAVNILKSSILEDGLVLSSAIDDVDQDGYVLAREITDTATRMLADLDTPIDAFLWDMLDAVALGNRVAEQVYTLDTDTTGRQRLMLRALKTKPRHSVAFVVDAFANMLGLLAVIPGLPLPVQQGMWVDPAHVPNLLPRDKFAIFSFRPVNGDPRGTSVLRPAYTPWNAKVQLYVEYMKYLTQFAAPSLIGYTAPDSQMMETGLDPLGNPMMDPSTGLPVGVQTPEQWMLASLTAFRNGTACAFPAGSKVDVVHSQGNGEPFQHAFDFFDRQVTKAILGQTLASEEGKHQARAAALVHQDVLDTLVRQAKWPVERMVVRDILRPWVRYNYGPGALPLVPTATLGRTEQADIAQMMMSVAALAAAGYIDPSQLQGIDAILNLPVRTPEEVAQKQAALQSILDHPPSPMPPAPSPIPRKEAA